MIRRGSLIALFLMLTFGFAASALAVETSGWVGDWQPRLTLGIIAQQQERDVRIESSLFTSAQNSPFVEEAPADFSNDASNFTVAFSLNAELMGPALGSGAAAPRPFIGISYQNTPLGDREVLSDGNPGAVVSPTASLGANGQGVRLDLEQRHQWRTSVGLSIPYEILDFPVSLRGSFDYFGQHALIDGTVVGVESEAGGTVFSLNWSGTEIFHFVGPRLGIEAEVGRRGPLLILGFADLAGYFRVGDAALEASTRVGTNTGRFSYEPDSFVFQGGLGIRIAWDPAGE